jgi:hypothetical protein
MATSGTDSAAVPQRAQRRDRRGKEQIAGEAAPQA